MVHSVRHIPPLAAAVLATLLALSCATATRQAAYVAPSYETIVADPEESADRVHQDFFIANHSTVPVVITSFQLTDCDNVANLCGARHMRILVSPGQRVLVATIGPEDRSRPYNFRYSWTWDVVH